MRITDTKTAAVWRGRVEAQRRSGLSAAAWCQANGVQVPSFYGWRTRLGLMPVRSPAPERPMGFAEVVVGPPRTEPTPASFTALGTVEPIRVRLHGGRELLLPMAMPLADVATLVRAIEGAA